MKILFTHMYFWPDSPPYAEMLRDIASGMADAGHDVHVFSLKPSYRGAVEKDGSKEEFLNGVSIRRGIAIRAKRSNKVVRVLNAIIYCLTLFFWVLRVRPDVVTAATFPPVLAAWAASLAARLCNAKLVYHMQDIHPEVSKYSGGAFGSGLAYYVLRVLDNQTLRRASTIVVLSKDMEQTLQERGLGRLPIQVINNLSLRTDATVEPMSEYVKAPGRKRIVFAGNLGRFQNLPLLAEGVAGCFESNPDVELMFLGDGEVEIELKEMWGTNRQVIFAPFMPFNQAKSLIEEADIGLVSLASNIYRVSYPSKMLTYLSLAVPVLVIVESDSELAKETVSSRLGEVPSELTAGSITIAVKSLLDDLNRKEAILEWYDRCSKREIVINRWANIFLALEA